jgi:hypothetical protein
MGSLRNPAAFETKKIRLERWKADVAYAFAQLFEAEVWGERSSLRKEGLEIVS